MLCQAAGSTSYDYSLALLSAAEGTLRRVKAPTLISVRGNIFG
jgi:hypothetical protein